MKLTLALNVWKYYIDTLLISEVARLQNEDGKIFEELHIISQGGHDEPPSKREQQYTDEHIFIDINEDYEAAKAHVKYKGIYRVLNGLKNAFHYANKQGSDFCMVTNADAWPLNLTKLKQRLSQADLQNCALATRVGLVTGLDLTYGDYVPMVDDHFMIINVKNCAKHGVFDYPGDPKAYDAFFKEYGGMHYMLMAMIDEIVPNGFYTAYSHVLDARNHFGERSAHSLIPWQFQPSLDFLHANCSQDEALHPLRAALLKHLGFGDYPEVRLYCTEYQRTPYPIIKTKNGVHYKAPFLEKLKVDIVFQQIKFFNYLKYFFKYKKHNRLKKEALHMNQGHLFYHNQMKDIYNIALSSRKVI